MKIVGVTACTAGIAHTYIVAQKIKDAAEAAGHDVQDRDAGLHRGGQRPHARGDRRPRTS